MSEGLVNPDVETLRVYFSDNRLSEQNIIDYVANEFEKFINIETAAELVTAILDQFNAGLDFTEHMFMVAYDYFNN